MKKKLTKQLGKMEKNYKEVYKKKVNGKFPIYHKQLQIHILWLKTILKTFEILNFSQNKKKKKEWKVRKFENSILG